MEDRVLDLERIYEIIDFHPTKQQEKAITNVAGPQLIIAGPGSGKTQVLVLRCLYLLLVKNVPPSKILICTYTEKAAASLEDRIRRAIRDLKVEVDLTEFWVETILSKIASELGMNKSTIWYMKKRLERTGSIRLYDKTKHHFQWRPTLDSIQQK